MNVQVRTSAADILRDMGLDAINPGACAGADGWSNASAQGAFATLNPATEEEIARISPATAADAERIISAAYQSFLKWRMVPAPRRGELVGRIGELLKENQAQLGALVSLETGKSLTEGKGEVGEMVDMARFAVGLSRQLYGFTMQSQRSRHRMYDQWLPLGLSASSRPITSLWRHGLGMHSSLRFAEIRSSGSRARKCRFPRSQFSICAIAP